MYAKKFIMMDGEELKGGNFIFSGALNNGMGVMVVINFKDPKAGDKADKNDEMIPLTAIKRIVLR